MTTTLPRFPMDQSSTGSTKVLPNKNNEVISLPPVSGHKLLVMQRHSALILDQGNMVKQEMMMGFSIKQMQRVKALKRLGTTEQEIWDAYAYKISQLGSQLSITAPQHKTSALI
ncbi:hypothetical protein THRCLA_22644 [Thraustotheca clavata]|uniref:Uncharacterized protein n=1 Tax=Thraustotheca clavata TaxID=74557 RepID=A0A1V9YVG0_9STRA|nr:hypothetical protein THRCLA_22644 [Thraustotheca clavata]